MSRLSDAIAVRADLGRLSTATTSRYLFAENAPVTATPAVTVLAVSAAVVAYFAEEAAEGN